MPIEMHAEAEPRRTTKPMGMDAPAAGETGPVHAHAVTHQYTATQNPARAAIQNQQP